MAIMRKKGSVALDQFPKVYPGVAYADLSKSQVLDLLLPEGDGPFPLILQVHGGGWISGSKLGEDEAAIFKLVSQGYAIASVEYRLAQEAKWPAQIYDVKAAVRFLRANAETYHLDCSHITAWGNSAGGHLVQFLAATNGDAEWEDLSMGNENQSSSVESLISWYGASDMMDDSKEKDPAFVPAKILMGFSREENPGAYFAASPIWHVTNRFPRSLFQHGYEDELIDWKQSWRIVEKINTLAGEKRADFELIAGGHGSPLIKNDDSMIRCLRFLDEQHHITRDYSLVSLPKMKVLF